MVSNGGTPVKNSEKFLARTRRQDYGQRCIFSDHVLPGLTLPLWLIHQPGFGRTVKEIASDRSASS
jgi:hypothetical protein